MRFINRDFLQSIPITFILIGLVLSLLGGFWVLDAGNRLSANLAEQFHNNSSEQPEEIPETQAYALLNADRERNELLQQRRNGIIAFGAGLVFLGFGWFSYDVVRSRLSTNSTSAIE